MHERTVKRHPALMLKVTFLVGLLCDTAHSSTYRTNPRLVSLATHPSSYHGEELPALGTAAGPVAQLSSGSEPSCNTSNACNLIHAKRVSHTRALEGIKETVSLSMFTGVDA
jgi:hypothetical protein